MIILTKEKYKKILDKLPDANSYKHLYYEVLALQIGELTNGKYNPYEIKSGLVDLPERILFRNKFSEKNKTHYWLLQDEIGII